MTAPNGPILFNSSTGSDTTASGLGAANVYGTGASTTGASAVVTGISTTGVSAGDLLWVQSSSGRQFSIIASVDSSTQVTCDDTFDNTESGRTWAIGGKRATFDGSSSIFGDLHGGWIIETETDQTVATDIRSYSVAPTGLSLGNNAIIRCNNKTITQTLPSFWTSVFLLRDYMELHDAVITTSVSNNGVALDSIYLSRPILKNVHVDPTIGGGGYTYGFYGSNDMAIDCTFKNMAYGWYGSGFCQFYRCVFDSNTVNGIYSQHHCSIYDSIVSNSGNHGINFSAGTRVYSVHRNVFYNNSGDGAVVAGYVAFGGGVSSNVFASNGGYGLNLTRLDNNTIMTNAYFSNASGNSIGENEYSPITLTADPFVDAANGDFNLNNAAGGGAVLRSTKYTLGG